MSDEVPGDWTGGGGVQGPGSRGNPPLPLHTELHQTNINHIDISNFFYVYIYT